MTTYRLAAHPFTVSRGFVSTILMMGGGLPYVLVTDAKKPADLERHIAEFGKAHAPCNVWVGVKEGRKMPGFDKWNDGAAKFLFYAEGPHCEGCGHPADSGIHTMGCDFAPKRT